LSKGGEGDGLDDNWACVDCAALAAQFGGGGHKEAAGATLNGSMTECVERVLQAARQTLGAGP